MKIGINIVRSGEQPKEIDVEPGDLIHCVIKKIIVTLLLNDPRVLKKLVLKKGGEGEELLFHRTVESYGINENTILDLELTWREVGSNGPDEREERFRRWMKPNPAAARAPPGNYSYRRTHPSEEIVCSPELDRLYEPFKEVLRERERNYWEGRRIATQGASHRPPETGGGTRRRKAGKRRGSSRRRRGSRRRAY